MAFSERRLQIASSDDRRNGQVLQWSAKGGFLVEACPGGVRAKLGDDGESITLRQGLKVRRCFDRIELVHEPATEGELRMILFGECEDLEGVAPLLVVERAAAPIVDISTANLLQHNIAAGLDVGYTPGGVEVNGFFDNVQTLNGGGGVNGAESYRDRLAHVVSKASRKMRYVQPRSMLSAPRGKEPPDTWPLVQISWRGAWAPAENTVNDSGWFLVRSDQVGDNHMVDQAPPNDLFNQCYGISLYNGVPTLAVRHLNPIELTSLAWPVPTEEFAHIEINTYAATASVPSIVELVVNGLLLDRRIFGEHLIPRAPMVFGGLNWGIRSWDLGKVYASAPRYYAGPLL